MKAPSYSPNAQPTLLGWVDDTGRIVKHTRFSQEEVDSWHQSKVKEVEKPSGMSTFVISNPEPEVKESTCSCGDPDCTCGPDCDCEPPVEATTLNIIDEIKTDKKIKNRISRVLKNLI